MHSNLELVDDCGRKYLTADERARFIAAAAHVKKPADQTFVLTIAHTGARVSEILALRALDVDLDAGAVRIRTLSRRALARGADPAGARTRSRDGAPAARGLAPADPGAALEVVQGHSAPIIRNCRAPGRHRGAAGLSQRLAP